MSTGKSSANRSLASSAGIISFATLCSRILGFLRDVIIARIFGVYIYAQAFVVAFKIPNLLRDLLGEGAANAALVPVFTEYRASRSKEEFWELANVVLNLSLVILAAVTILGIIFSGLIVRLIAPGFLADPEKLAATVKLSRIIFPYILLISLSAYSMSLLNSLRHFAIPAFAPCLLNISIILFALVFGEGIKGLSLGVLVGGALQLAVQIPVLYRKGFRFKPFKRFRHPQAKEIGRLMLPRILSSSIYQLNNFVDSIFASFAVLVGEGGVAVLYFAYRLILFPLGIFSTALSQAVLPTFSSQALEPGKKSLKDTLHFSLRANFFVLLPASAGFMALAYPIVSILFGGGRFDDYSARSTAQALFFYSIGLFAYGGTKILQSCFFALKDTVTPTKVAGMALAMNIVLNCALVFMLKLKGIALATSISGIFTFLILFFRLKKKLRFSYTGDILISFTRSLCASACTGCICYLAWSSNVIDIGNTQKKFLNLGTLLVLGAASYMVFCALFRVKEMSQLREWIVEKTRTR